MIQLSEILVVQKPRQPLVALAIGAALLGLVGCAAKPIKPTYVPATDYQSMNCEGLRAEYGRVNSHIEQGTTEKSSLFSGVGVGVGAFGGSGGWGIGPSLSFGVGKQTSGSDAAYARLLGQREAVSQQAVLQGCPIAPPVKSKR
jgi:hypothetical protein